MNYTHKYLNLQRQKLLRFMNSNVGLKHWQTSKHWYLLLIWGGKVLGFGFLPSCFNITHAFAYIYIYVSNNYFHCFCLIVHVYLSYFAGFDVFHSTSLCVVAPPFLSTLLLLYFQHTYYFIKFIRWCFFM